MTKPPMAAAALGRVHLVYELHITNFGTTPAGIDQLDVLGDADVVLASWTGPQLWQRISVLDQPAIGSEPASW